MNNYQIYVADLSDYNAGILNGFWMDISGLDADDMQAQIQDWLKDVSDNTGQLHEEYAIHDYDGIPDFGEYPNFEKIAEYVRLIEEHEDAFAAAFNALELIHEDSSNWENIFEDAYCGSFDNGLSDYANELVDEGCFGDVQDSIKQYIDYDAIARDLEIDGYQEHNGYVFRPY